MNKAPESREKVFLFRGLHQQNVLISTASDRYAGWIGQIYSKGRYEKGITRRSHKVGGKTFHEETLPVESVAEYFEHFPLLEIDYTFYHPLLESNGKPTQNFHVLKQYRQYMKDEELVLLKVPQIIIARKLSRGSAFVENERYLNPDIFTRQFYHPAIEILGIGVRIDNFNNSIMIPPWHGNQVFSTVGLRLNRDISNLIVAARRLVEKSTLDSHLSRKMEELKSAFVRD